MLCASTASCSLRLFKKRRKALRDSRLHQNGSALVFMRLLVFVYKTDFTSAVFPCSFSRNRSRRLFFFSGAATGAATAAPTGTSPQEAFPPAAATAILDDFPPPARAGGLPLLLAEGSGAPLESEDALTTAPSGPAWGSTSAARPYGFGITGVTPSNCSSVSTSTATSVFSTATAGGIQAPPRMQRPWSVFGQEQEEEEVKSFSGMLKAKMTKPLLMAGALLGRRADEDLPEPPPPAEAEGEGELDEPESPVPPLPARTSTSSWTSAIGACDEDHAMNCVDNYIRAFHPSVDDVDDKTQIVDVSPRIATAGDSSSTANCTTTCGQAGGPRRAADAAAAGNNVNPGDPDDVVDVDMIMEARRENDEKPRRPGPRPEEIEIQQEPTPRAATTAKAEAEAAPNESKAKVKRAPLLIPGMVSKNIRTRQLQEEATAQEKRYPHCTLSALVRKFEKCSLVGVPPAPVEQGEPTKGKTAASRLHLRLGPGPASSTTGGNSTASTCTSAAKTSLSTSHPREQNTQNADQDEAAPLLRLSASLQALTDTLQEVAEDCTNALAKKACPVLGEMQRAVREGAIVHEALTLFERHGADTYLETKTGNEAPVNEDPNPGGHRPMFLTTLKPVFLSNKLEMEQREQAVSSAWVGGIPRPGTIDQEMALEMALERSPDSASCPAFRYLTGRSLLRKIFDDARRTTGRRPVLASPHLEGAPPLCREASEENWALAAESRLKRWWGRTEVADSSCPRRAGGRGEHDVRVPGFTSAEEEEQQPLQIVVPFGEAPSDVLLDRRLIAELTRNMKEKAASGEAQTSNAGIRKKHEFEIALGPRGDVITRKWRELANIVVQTVEWFEKHDPPEYHTTGAAPNASTSSPRMKSFNHQDYDSPEVSRFYFSLSRRLLNRHYFGDLAPFVDDSLPGNAAAAGQFEFVREAAVLFGPEEVAVDDLHFFEGADEKSAAGGPGGRIMVGTKARNRRGLDATSKDSASFTPAARKKPLPLPTTLAAGDGAADGRSSRGTSNPELVLQLREHNEDSEMDEACSSCAALPDSPAGTASTRTPTSLPTSVSSTAQPASHLPLFGRTCCGPPCAAACPGNGAKLSPKASRTAKTRTTRVTATTSRGNSYIKAKLQRRDRTRGKKGGRKKFASKNSGKNPPSGAEPRSCRSGAAAACSGAAAGFCMQRPVLETEATVEEVEASPERATPQAEAGVVMKDEDDDATTSASSSSGEITTSPEDNDEGPRTVGDRSSDEGYFGGLLFAGGGSDKATTRLINNKPIIAEATATSERKTSQEQHLTCHLKHAGNRVQSCAPRDKFSASAFLAHEATIFSKFFVRKAIQRRQLVARTQNYLGEQHLFFADRGAVLGLLHRFFHGFLSFELRWLNEKTFHQRTLSSEPEREPNATPIPTRTAQARAARKTQSQTPSPTSRASSSFHDVDDPYWVWTPEEAYTEVEAVVYTQLSALVKTTLRLTGDTNPWRLINPADLDGLLISYLMQSYADWKEALSGSAAAAPVWNVAI